MSNIYEVLLQTINVSAICVIILALKWLLQDKLSPKWQYGIWSVLIICILVPYKLKTYMIPAIILPIEIIKTNIEKGISSSYIDIYETLNPEHVLPIFSGKPSSITDILLLVYIIGIMLYLLWNIVSYMRLRLELNKGKIAENDYLSTVCDSYGLKCCKVIEVDGLESTFICGVLNPILAVPAGEIVNDKVLLHELIHLKYKDPLQNVFWCILKSLHWFNPFVHYVFNRIGNDIESLCDQRVLELLDGEDRREYGNILLDMANNKYSRMPGTSSISNGGKNITRRIESIVRFKLYPKGMRIVSICTIIVLASTILSGQTVTYSQSEYNTLPSNESKAMAITRLNRCNTLAAALDTYGKGIVTKNIMYIATASPLDRQSELEAEMKANFDNGNIANHYDVQEVFEDLNWSLSFLNLYKVTENRYTAYIAFTTDSYELLEDSDYEYAKDSILLPVEVYKENGWVVREIGEPIVYKGVDAIWNYAEFNYDGGAKVLKGQGETGSIEVVINNFYEVDNTKQNSYTIGYMYESFSPDINVDAEFYNAYNSIRIKYNSNTKTIEDSPKNVVKMFHQELTSVNNEYEFPNSVKEYNDTDGYYYTMSGSESGSYYMQIVIDEAWDGILTAGDGYGISGDEVLDIADAPSVYVCRILWDGKEMEDIIATEVQP